jgi:hypothetical protein
MRRYLYICVALAVTGAVLSGQVGGQRRGSDGQVPAAQYSPLAAEGGYSRAHTSPLDAMVHALNPHNVDLGAVWEARRRAWLENAGANRYFWYSFAARVVLRTEVNTRCVTSKEQLP